MNQIVSSRDSNRLGAGASESGLTRLDVTATVAVLGVLALLNLASVSHNQAGSDAATCMANLRDLTRAWQQFAVDEGRFPPNPDDGNTTAGFNWVSGQSGRGGAHEFNSDILTDPSRSLLYPYLSYQNPSAFRCPANAVHGRYQGSDPLKLGTIVPAARAYAMNLAVGTDPYSPGGLLPVNGAWLDNNHAHLRGRTWRTYARLEDIVDPAPGSLIVLLEEDPYSINDGLFAFGMQTPEWIDWPATRHRMGGTLSYADGHVQLRRWMDQRTVVQANNVARRRVPDSPDYDWVRERISARLTP